jgi:hypothetical protein
MQKTRLRPPSPGKQSQATQEPEPKPGSIVRRSMRLDRRTSELLQVALLRDFYFYLLCNPVPRLQYLMVVITTNNGHQPWAIQGSLSERPDQMSLCPSLAWGGRGGRALI